MGYVTDFTVAMNNSSNNNPLRLEVFLPALLFLKSIINDKVYGALDLIR